MKLKRHNNFNVNEAAESAVRISGKSRSDVMDTLWSLYNYADIYNLDIRHGDMLKAKLDAATITKVMPMIKEFHKADEKQAALLEKIFKTVLYNEEVKESEKTIDGILHINLLDKYAKFNDEYRAKFDQYKQKINGFTEEGPDGLKAGDVIEFNGGYNNDIRYTTEVLGFDKDGDIYLLWDSFWYPIKPNDYKRNIKIISRA